MARTAARIFCAVVVILSAGIIRDPTSSAQGGGQMPTFQVDP
jgi:hypothetical protein